MLRAKRAFEAKKRAENLGITPEVWRELEEETDRDHAYFSSLVSGMKLSRVEFNAIYERFAAR